MSLASRLLADGFSSEDEVDDDDGTGSGTDLVMRDDGYDDNDNSSFTTLMSSTNLNNVHDLRKYSKLLPKVETLLNEMNQLQQSDSDLNMIDKELENDFLSKTNDTLDDLKQEIVTIHAFIKIHYKLIWPDLDGLIQNPVNFAKIIKIIKDKIELVSESNDEFSKFLKKDEILGLTVSASVLKQQQQQQQRKIPQHNMDLILQACDILLEFEDARQSIRSFVSNRARSIAPNVTAIVGPHVTAQLISIHGLEGLCKTPSCNLPSLGVNTSSSSKGLIGTRNKGYLYYSDLVQNVFEDYRVQAMRIISGKVILAARIDFSNRESNYNKYDDNNGLKWRDEIIKKLDKLQAPPENSKIKPLPKPIDNKSKKRAGKRFRKQKERLEMSDIAKAQNKMAFGNQEETHMDAFGEEHGMGMIGKLSTRSLTNNESLNKPQIGKALASKLKSFGVVNQQQQSSKLANLLNGNDTLKALEGQGQEQSPLLSSSSSKKPSSLDWLNARANLKRHAESDIDKDKDSYKRLK
ncbi:hypothetical protein CANARDRAFT_29449 [[Candida] arabinofermentans NRRL YB-2248]|uniref:Nop domain-containing protein n=1 Tax=[Candida] arabinofermentans NRRL YB-2248 TaxID=983967 RepID=A0A1E4SWV2_9ASCO|nr:hypothetical protein CANARDRAFT_29449 [[Candida] arabinofermentans NRRL YB-2248]